MAKRRAKIQIGTLSSFGEFKRFMIGEDVRGGVG